MTANLTLASSLFTAKATLSLYTLFFGFVVVMLEGNGKFYPDRWKRIIRTQAKFLTLLNGRGAFYVFLGTLLMAQWPTAGPFLLGIYMAAVGTVMFVYGYHAKAKLDSVRSLLSSEDVVTSAFEKADAEGDGSLTAAELGELCASLGSTLEPQEIEAALLALDKDGNGGISFEEFVRWWKGSSDGLLF